MTRISIASVGLGVVLLSAHVKAQDDLNSVLAKAMKDSPVPAMAVVRIQHGKITGEAVRGVRSVDAPDMVTTTDVWHIGSDGKAMTEPFHEKFRSGTTS